MKNTLYIVDDHRLMLKGLKDYLEENSSWRVQKTCATIAECLDALEAVTSKDKLPEIIIVDAQLQGESGFDLVETLTKKYPAVKTVVYSMFDTSGYIMQAKAAGVKGYISKVASEEELLACLKVVQEGGEYFEQKAVDSIKKIEKVSPLLTRQEKRILGLLLQQKSNEEISETLGITLHTVENYVSYIYDKLSVKNREDLSKIF